MTAAETANNNDREIVIARDFNAPRQLVWDVWTDPKHREKWFGPAGYRMEVISSDFREGGKWSEKMIGPEGEFPYSGVYKEIVPIERIVSTDDFDETVKESMPDLPQGMVVTTLFDDKGEQKTGVTIRTLHPTAEDKKKHEAMGVETGWASTLDNLDEYLEGLQK
jgi:uncharacterized protein YndB with AHSA1/START domain